MNKNPLVSVILANYNNAAYLRTCLNSILYQTYKPLEIIVYDDCSKDESRNILNSYVLKYNNETRSLKVIYGTVNKGVATARHEAIMQAQGEYITTLDSDDYYYNVNKLEKEMALALHYKKEENKDILPFSGVVSISGDGTLTLPRWNPEKVRQGNILKELLARSCTIPRDFIMKREAYFEAGGYDRRLVTHEDWDLKIRLAKKYEYYYSGIIGIAYRRHSQGLSSLPHRKRTANLRRVFYKNLHLVDDKTGKKSIEQDFLQFMQKRDQHFLKDLDQQAPSLYEKLRQLGTSKFLSYLAAYKSRKMVT